MKNELNFKERLQRIYFFFPFQLLILHFKKNHLLLVFWVLLLGFTTQAIGVKYGVPILFLFPEYLGKNDFWSYLILGFATGGFIIAFNLYSYIMHGFRFPFIASLARPFFKFSINNFLIPLIYIITYICFSAKFQLEKELLAPREVFINIMAYLTGITLFSFISLSYFLRTNRDIFNIHRKNKYRGIQKLQEYSFLQMANRWKGVKQNNRTWRVDTYMSHPLSIALARGNEHYSSEIIEKVFSQNHINASIFEILTILSFLLLGSLREIKPFLIPAAASIFLLFTMLLMFVSALYSWFKGWTTSVIIALLLLINVASSRDNFLNVENRAYGINYNAPSVNYPEYLLKGLPSNQLMVQDAAKVQQILEQWKAKIFRKYGEKNPAMILLNCSGGGLRSSLWTLRSLSHLDSLSGGRFFDHVVLITGSSGGMIGAATYRELMLQQQITGIKEDGMKYFDMLGSDILNPLAFSFATNDLLIRYQNFKDNNNVYTKDRAYSFEKQLNENISYLLSKRMGDYRKAEAEAKIPMMIISPTIANDGRKLLISATPISFLTRTQISGINTKSLAENISMSHLLATHQPDSLKLLSALRMSATFPYIMPAVTLPTIPKIDVMDSGMRDNFGYTTTAPFIVNFKDWIAKNTGGVLVVQLRDLEKKARFSSDINTNFSARVASPLGTVYNNLLNTHNYAQDEVLEQMKLWVNFPFELITYELVQEESSKISLSWHLTEYERQQIRQGTSLTYNKISSSGIINFMKIPN